MIAVPAGMRVLVATKPVDFRRGADGLVALVRETLGHDPFSGTVFVFRSKRADRVKIVAWDGTMSVLENLPSVIDRPRRSRRAVATAPDQAKPTSSSSSVAPITRAPSSPRTGNHEKGIGAAGDLTIVRPAAAAPPRRPEQVGRHRAAQPRARA
jgi:transposase